jgi:hypothetical protein
MRVVYGINPLAAIVQNASASFLWSKTERKMYREPFLNNNFLVLDIIFCRKSLELTKIIIKKLIKLNEYGLSDLELHIDKPKRPFAVANGLFGLESWYHNYFTLSMFSLLSSFNYVAFFVPAKIFFVVLGKTKYLAKL